MTTSSDAGLLQEVPPRRLRAPKVATAARVNLNNASFRELVNVAGFTREEAKYLVAARRRNPIRTIQDMSRIALLSKARLRELADHVVPLLHEEVAILNVQVADERVMSEQPWSLEVSFKAPHGCPAALAALKIKWRGTPFSVERLVSPEENEEGRFLFEIGKDQSLPPGPIGITLRLYDTDGGCDAHQRELMVFPSNPLSLFVSPANRSIYNGSVRPDWSNPNWVTRINVTLVNGDATLAFLARNATWQFWDGPVGSGTLVEGGTVDFGGNITVPAFGRWDGWITFSSPPGSGIHGRYEDLEDMAIQIVMTRTNGSTVAGQITCRVMAGFGINVIRVGDTTAAEDTTIANGVNDARDVYEDHGFTFSSIQWWVIHDTDVGGYQFLGSEDEWEDLLDDWTVPNDSVDCFIVSGMWDGFAGYSPEPGPDEKDGDCENDGLASTQSGVCLAHELGHYIGGLCHPDDGGCSESNSLGGSNVMFSVCGGRNFFYSQYRKLLGHGWVRIVR